MKKAHFQILSNYKDEKIVSLSLKQIENSDLRITFDKVDELTFRKNSFQIIGITGLEDNNFNKILKLKESEKEKVVVFTKSNNILLASTISRFGFRNLFVLPFELQKFKNHLIDSISEYFAKRNRILSDALEISFDAFDLFMGQAEKTIHLLELSKKVTLNNNVNSLILGETGTGKGLLAKCIHEASLRRNKPYIDINCAAIPHHLLESELFGYERGAFTDARSTKIGLMELAEDGTIFLDEIGDMSLEVQAKLLRAIDNKMIRRLGGTEDIPIKARIISATNHSLDLLIEQNKFRKDLYHRLNVITLTIAPLRERKDDIIYLAEKFSEEISETFGKKKIVLNDDIKEFMLSYSWPGNVRELRNSIERGILLADGKKFKLKQMFLDYKGISVKQSDNEDILKLEVDYQNKSLTQITKLYVNNILKRVGGNKSKAAKILNISRPRLDRIIK